MTDDLAPQAVTDEPAWPARAMILLVLGAAAALALQQLIEPDDWQRFGGSVPDWRMACATGIGVGALAFGFGLSRVRIGWTAVFAVTLGLIAGLIAWWDSQPAGVWNWGGVSLFLAIAIAVPLFQVARDEGRASFPYSQVHGHAWTNVVLWGACWGFTGIVVLLSHLLGELFALIGIQFLKDVLEKSWSNALIIGAAFGAVLALLRDRDTVVRLLQRVVTSVLSFLAPILGGALLLFIVSLPFTGLNNLWEATKSTTPILMACVIGALVLANAVIGHGPDDEAKSPVLRWSAMALGVSVLPLAIIAAIAMGLRLNQYGATPDRLWGLTVVVFAVGYGVVYLTDLARKQLDWAPLIRRDNIRLAIATMAAALLLATPLLGFNAISMRDQVARLKSGKVAIDKFDWAALAFDFGEPGKRALAELQRAANPVIAKRAVEVAKADSRWNVREAQENRVRATDIAAHLRVLPAGTPLPDGLRDGIARSIQCDRGHCTVFMIQPDQQALVMDDACFAEPPPGKGPVWPVPNCGDPVVWHRDKDGWSVGASAMVQPDVAAVAARNAGYKAGKVEVRTVTRRQVFVGGSPVGPEFE